MGYPYVVTRQLNAQGFKVSLTNYGLPTAVIGPDFQLLGQQSGRTIVGNLISNEMPFLLKTATLVTVFAGGNDVNTITAALGNPGVGDPNAFIDTQVQAFRDDYTTLLNGIRTNAPSARIIVLNLPNIAGLPYLSGASSAQRQAAQRASVAMTLSVINPLASSGVIVLDMMCDARSYNPANYSSDGFHPNDAGYAFIAGEILQAVTATSWPAPASSCGYTSQI